MYAYVYDEVFFFIILSFFLSFGFLLPSKFSTTILHFSFSFGWVLLKQHHIVILTFVFLLFPLLLFSFSFVTGLSNFVVTYAARLCLHIIYGMVLFSSIFGINRTEQTRQSYSRWKIKNEMKREIKREVKKKEIK